ncbi:MAG: type II toxin-antitoxin system VapC family toxin [Candidatus Binatia bacterium]
MILVDTSVWVAVLSRRPPFRLESRIDFREVVTCPVVVQEVLQGIRDESAFRRVRTSLLALPMVESPVPIDRFIEAATLHRLARAAGKSVRAGADCLIAAFAIRHDLEVLHRDRDFGALAEISSLRQRSV